MPTKKKIFAYCLLEVPRYFNISLQRQQVIKKSQNSRNKYFLLVDWRIQIQIRTVIIITDPERPKNFRIRNIALGGCWNFSFPLNIIGPSRSFYIFIWLGRVETAGGVQAAAGQGELHLPRVRHHHEPALPRRGEVRARRWRFSPSSGLCDNSGQPAWPPFYRYTVQLFSVVRIRDVLVRIRIRYLWLTDPDPAIFFSELQDSN